MDGDIIKSGDLQQVNRRLEKCNGELNLAQLQLEIFPGDIFGVSYIRTLNLRGIVVL